MPIFTPDKSTPSVAISPLLNRSDPRVVKRCAIMSRVRDPRKSTKTKVAKRREIPAGTKQFRSARGKLQSRKSNTRRPTMRAYATLIPSLPILPCLQPVVQIQRRNVARIVREDGHASAADTSCASSESNQAGSPSIMEFDNDKASASVSGPKGSSACLLSADHSVAFGSGSRGSFALPFGRSVSKAAAF